MTKKEYTKPSVKLVEWNFSEAVCNTVSTNSYATCLDVKKGTMVNQAEVRSDKTGVWSRVGSQ